MGFFSRIFGKSEQRPAMSRRARAQMLRAKYDAAQTTHENRRHWANADLLSADAAMSPDIRRILRSRARYEVANNCYAKGIVHTKANFIVGTGPRLQMLLDNSEDNRIVEKEFARWARRVGLAHKLRCMRIAQCESGEVFAILTNNPRLRHPVQLDLRLIEADQVATPWPVGSAKERTVDGIVFDEWDNPESYYVLKEHPGSNDAWRHGLDEYKPVPASHVIHLFHTDRPGQHRGIPELTPALPLFALLRRYTLATVSSAEMAALMSGWLFQDTADTDDGDDADGAWTPFEEHDLARGAWTVAPPGLKPAQLKAEQPTTVYSNFKRELVNEIARCVLMSYNIAAGNSSDYNYASGQLDHQSFFKAIAIDQAFLAEVVLDRIFEAWLDEAVLIEGYLPAAARMRGAGDEHQWFWDGIEHVDPTKKANSQETKLRTTLTNLSIEYARDGRDWETEVRQRAKELKLLKELDMTPEQAAPATVAVRDDDDDEDDEDK